MNLLLFADGEVGRTVFDFLADAHREDIAHVVTIKDNDLSRRAAETGITSSVFDPGPDFPGSLQRIAPEGKFDLGLLAWWPKIIRQELIDLPRAGLINFHPSFLPFNRGTHYNFWALAEQCPFGVTLHFVDRGIDSGDIVAQERIPYDWTDTGGTLYFKAKEAMVELFKKNYSRLRDGAYTRRPQDHPAGSFHSAAELDAASRIDLDAQYRARDLLNLLRARTFPGHPACYFSDGNKKYEIRVDIREAE